MRDPMNRFFFMWLSYLLIIVYCHANDISMDQQEDIHEINSAAAVQDKCQDTIQSYEDQLKKCQSHLTDEIEQLSSQHKMELDKTQENLDHCLKTKKSLDQANEECQTNVEKLRPLSQKLNACMETTTSLREESTQQRHKYDAEIQSMNDRYLKLQEQYTSQLNIHHELSECSEKIRHEAFQRRKAEKNVTSLSNTLMLCQPYLTTRQELVRFLEKTRIFLSDAHLFFSASILPSLHTILQTFTQKSLSTFQHLQQKLEANFLHHHKVKPYWNQISTSSRLAVEYGQKVLNYWDYVRESPIVTQAFHFISLQLSFVMALLFKQFSLYADKSLAWLKLYCPRMHTMVDSWHPQEWIYFLVALITLHSCVTWIFFFVKLVWAITQCVTRRLWRCCGSGCRDKRKSSNKKPTNRTEHLKDPRTLTATQGPVMPTLDTSSTPPLSLQNTTASVKLPNASNKSGKNSHHRHRH